MTATPTNRRPRSKTWKLADTRKRIAEITKEVSRDFHAAVRAKTRCRHRDTWLTAGGTREWCYRCGAIRHMLESGIAQVRPMSPWCRPVGPTAPNPFPKWNARLVAYQRRHRL